MPDDKGEQQQVSDVGPETPRTVQERVIGLYNSKAIHHIAVGYWLKLLIEAVIVSVPLLILPLVGSGLTFAGIGPFSYAFYWGLWITFSVTILGFSWCLTEPGSDESGESEDSQD